MATAARACPRLRLAGTARVPARRARDHPAPPARVRGCPAPPRPPPLRPAVRARSPRSCPVGTRPPAWRAPGHPRRARVPPR
eukprot:1084817-Pleurochrysis_carterae.AAC.1